MGKFKNQIFIVLSTLIFIISVMLAQHVITQKIYNENDFNDTDYIVENKVFLLKNVYYDGKHLSNTIIENMDISKLLIQNEDLNNTYISEFQSFFKTDHTLSNITLFNEKLNIIGKYFKNNENIDIDKNNLEKFFNSKQKEILSPIYLTKVKEKIQIPYLPKISYLKKIYSNNKLIGVLALEYDLNFRFKNFYSNKKYDFILIDEKANTLFHYDDLKSWSKYINRTDVFDESIKTNINSILSNEIFTNVNFHSHRLDLNIQDGLILISTLNKDFISNKENLQFKRKMSFFLFFLIATIIILTLVLIILEKSSKSLLKVQSLSKELKNVQKFFNLAQKVGQIGLWKVDVYNNLTWNDWMFKILEMNNDKSKISYDNFISFIHPDDKEKFDTEYRYSKNKTKENYLTYRIITSSGKTKWVEQRWKHIYTKDNKFLYTIGSLHDITKRKNIEDLLKIENDNLVNRIDNFPQGIVILDLENEVQFVNKTFENLLGYTQKEIFRKKKFDMFLNEDKELFSLVMIDILEKKLIKNQEVKFVKNNGEVITTDISMIYNDNTKEVIITINDVTNNVRNHDKYLINQSRLANLGEMLIDLTYQWRQPLSIISTSASFLKLEHEIDAQQKEETIDVLAKIIQSSNRLSNTIDDFRYYVEDKKEESTFSVNNSIEKVLIILENQIYEHEIELITDYDEDVEIRNVENSFMQVLVNVIKNSIEALEDYPKQKKIIKITTSILKDKLEVNITDNAHGIEESIMPKIFNEFFTTKTSQNSTGLGLYLTRKIVSSKLKGSIIARNKEFKYKNINYKGVCFTISISLLNKELNNE